MRVTGFAAVLAVSLLVSVPAWAADVATDMCAVSGVNGKIALEGGAWDADGYNNEEQFQGVASLSLPMGCLFGLQVDAGAGEFGAANAVGVGGHLFMRDPSSYLFGVHATYEDWSFDAPALDVQSIKVGAEAELYLGNVSLEAWAGIEDTNRTNSDVFGKLTAALYVTPDLRVAAGLRHAADFTSGALTAEWQMADMPLAFTAEAEIGEDDFHAISVGAKFYFGGTQKALIDRHRQDDPDDGLFDFLGSASAVGCLPAAGGTTDDFSITESEFVLDGVVTSNCGAPLPPEEFVIDDRD